jgi:hypothetical protein
MCQGQQAKEKGCTSNVEREKKNIPDYKPSSSLSRNGQKTKASLGETNTDFIPAGLVCDLNSSLNDTQNGPAQQAGIALENHSRLDTNGNE